MDIFSQMTDMVRDTVQNGYGKTGSVDNEGKSSQERLATVAALNSPQNLADFTKYANEKG